MLIPPSLLMIIFGVLANTSIGNLFTAGIIPGVIEPHSRSAMCGSSYFREDFVFQNKDAAHRERTGAPDDAPIYVLVLKVLPVCILVGMVLGGIYGGFFTPTEAGGAGALIALIIAIAQRALTPRLFWEGRWRPAA